MIGPSGGAGFTARLHAWLSDARVDDSAAGRARERWLQTAAEADATFGGVLLDLAERGGPITLGLTGGRRHRGQLVAVGADFVAVALAAGGEVLIARGAIASLRASPRSDAALGEQAVTTDLRLGDVLAELAAERSRVLLLLGDRGDPVGGEARAAGRDVLTVRVDGDPPALTYVPLGAITEVVL